MTLRTGSRKEVLSDWVGARQYAIEPRSKSCGQIRLKSPSARGRSEAAGEDVEALDGESREAMRGGLDHRSLEMHRIREALTRSGVENDYFT